MNKHLGIFFFGLVLLFAPSVLAFSPSKCSDLRKDIELTYLSYLDNEDELANGKELISREVIEQQSERYLREASQLSKIYSVICD